MSSAGPVIRGAEWCGAEGLSRLQQFGAFRSEDPGGFRADWHGVEIDGLELAEWRCTPVIGRLHPEPAGPVRLDAVLSGRARYRIGGEDFIAEPGSVLLMRVHRGFQFTCQGLFRVAQVRLAGAVPLWLSDPDSILDGLLPATHLTAGFVALTDRLTASARDRPGELLPTTAKAIRSVAAAVVEEALPRLPGRSDLRAQIVRYIDRHLGDHELGPQQIADAFGISLRWAHQTFNRDQQSLACYIRHRRVDAVAQTIRTSSSPARVHELALRFGFRGRDQLTRAFKQRYGSTISDYRSTAAQAADRSPTAITAAHG